MSHEAGDKVNSSDTYELPGNDKIIEDVIESCTNLKVAKENEGGDGGVIEEIDQCEEEDDDKNVVDEDFIDDVALKDLELSLTPEEIEKNKVSASELKNSGNILFKDKKHEEARKKYTEALRICPIGCIEERAILFSNRAACKMALELKKEAISDCDRAIELNPSYVRALSRRAKLYETTEKLDEALEDYKKIMEIDPGNSEARSACMRLPSEINERNEKLKEQMLTSLKELGNKILKPFGLSTNNFQVQKDPNSGDCLRVMKPEEELLIFSFPN